MTESNSNNILLTDKIKELEALLETQEQNNKQPAQQKDIPILYDVVVSGNHSDEEVLEPKPSPSVSPDIAELAQRLEKKFSMELDEIINILKSNLKDSIMTELKDELQKKGDQ